MTSTIGGQLTLEGFPVCCVNIRCAPWFIDHSVGPLSAGAPNLLIQDTELYPLHLLCDSECGWLVS